MNGSKPPSKIKKRLKQQPDHKNYEVGHGKPPEATRFKLGQSGNPKGRPKGKRNKPETPHHERLKSIILEEAYRTIKVNDGTAQVTVPMAQAVMRSLAVTAAKGNTRAQKLFSELLANTELSNKQADDEWLRTMIDYKSSWEQELDRRKFHNVTTLPDPLPHPDDIIVDFRRSSISIRGPMDKRELADLDLWLNRKNEFEAELLYLNKTIGSQQSRSDLDFFEHEINFTKRLIEIADRSLSLRASPECVRRRLSQLNLSTPDYVVKLTMLDEL